MLVQKDFQQKGRQLDIVFTQNIGISDCFIFNRSENKKKLSNQKVLASIDFYAYATSWSKTVSIINLMTIENR